MDHSEKVAADKTSLGFEFQDLVYIEKLIELRPGQKLGLEVHDDIHVETVADDTSIEDLLLIQVKHSVDPGNVTDRDVDLWKTIDNWLKIIPGLPHSRRLTFQLYTNKSLNSQALVSLLKSPVNNIAAILEHIRKTEEELSSAEAKKKEGSSPNPIAKFVNSVSLATDEQLKFLFERFEFHSDNSSILARLSAALRQLSIPQARLADTRKHVIGAFKESKFSRIVSGEKVIISFDDFRVGMGFDRIVRSARAEAADFDRFVDLYYSYQRPDTLSFSSSNFHRQLKDLGISDEEIVTRGVEMMLAEQFMQSLEDEGSFSASDNVRLENIAISEWQTLHNKAHRKTDSDESQAHQEAALGCYDATMENPLRSGLTQLPSNLSCGKYIKLSNLPSIGWRKNWQDRFNK